MTKPLNIRPRITKGVLVREYTPEEDAYIAEHFSNMSLDDIALTLNRTAVSVRNRAYGLGIYKKKHLWTQKEDEFIFDHADDMSTKEMADILGIKPFQVSRRLYMYKIRKSYVRQPKTH